MLRATEALREPLMSAYGPCGGMPALVDALKQKLADENGLHGVRPVARSRERLPDLHLSDERGSLHACRRTESSP